MISLTSDYVKDTGDPSPYLRDMAEAGFTHTHWCHHWITDFLYSKWEIDQIGKWFDEYGIALLDIHGSDGVEKRWTSEKEYERLAGIELVQNRIDMAAALSGDAVIMHLPTEPGHEQLCRSMDVVVPYARERGVRIALENGSFDAIEWMLNNYPPDVVGLCYDSGHGNIDGDGLDRLEKVKDRLYCVHLDDNLGGKDYATCDLHNPLFSGTVDWPRLASIMARSSYTKCVSMEINMPRSGIEDEKDFLKVAFETGTRFADMIEAERKAL